MPMNLLYSPENRAERLIAVGRVGLAASSLLAVWLDPTEPAKFASVAYALLTSYVAYSGLLALWVSRAPLLSNRQKLWTHGFDLAFFSLPIVYLADAIRGGSPETDRVPPKQPPDAKKTGSWIAPHY